MPKRKKQNQQQQLPPPQPPLPEPGETGDEDDRSPIGPPSLLGPPPMANGKPGDPKSAPNWKPPTCPSPVEWINKLLYMHAMGYYTAMKMNELLLQATNLDESHKHDVERKKPDTKECRLYDSIYAKFKNRQKLTYGVRSQDSGYLWEEGGIVRGRGTWGDL
nr:proline-rich protein 3 isoform X5 [Loxodonta africana]